MGFDINIVALCWAVFRAILRSFAEGAFVCLLVNGSIDSIDSEDAAKTFAPRKQRRMWLFVFVYVSVATIFTLFIPGYFDFFRLVSVVLVFFHSWNRCKRCNRPLISNYGMAHDAVFSLNAAIISILAVSSFNFLSFLSLHYGLVFFGVYDYVRGVDALYQVYKFSIALLDVFVLFLFYKLRIIKLKDIRSMSINKWVPLSFGFSLLAWTYLAYFYNVIYDTPAAAIYKDAVLGLLALMLPLYVSFYLSTRYLTKLLCVKTNFIADRSILDWVSDPSVVETSHLDVYDSDLFMANYMSQKFVFEKKLRKLGITCEHKGFSELSLCLILTKMFTGLKGWNFERDVLGQVSLVVDEPISKFHKDIEHTLAYVWDTNEVSFLIEKYYLPYQHVGTYRSGDRPSVEEFIMTIAKSA